MDIHCPKCDELLVFDINNENSGEKGVKNTRCHKCASQIKIDWNLTFQIKTIEPKEEKFLLQNPVNQHDSQNEIKEVKKGIQYGTVLVAVERLEERNFIESTLKKGGFSVKGVSNGSEALEIFKKEIPGILLVEVGLPQIFGFELCEIIKKSPLLQEVKVVLLASTNKESVYKRAPENLFGADDFIEHLHIEKDLVLKINRLIPKGNGILKESVAHVPEILKKESMNKNEGGSNDTPVDKPMEDVENSPGDINDKVAPSNNHSMSVPENGLAKPESPEYEAAKRLARIIISDIALYNKQKIVEGLQRGNLIGYLKNELEEGLKLYRERVPQEVLNSSNYLDEALKDFIKQRKSVPQ